MIYNPDDLADNLRKNGGFVPGIRPGKKTSEYIDKILGRITFIGAVYVAFVCVNSFISRTGAVQFTVLFWRDIPS